MEELYSKLINHNDRDIYPMHMPGHKRNTDIMDMVNPYIIDITEIDGFDNMHNPKDIIKNIENKASTLYKTKETLLSVSGSSMGIMAAICAVTHRKGRILISRNSHKSVYNAIELNELQPEYIYPNIGEYGIAGGINLTDIIKKVEEFPDICAVVVTNPTYEGIVSNIGDISSYLHRKGIPLIVDGAHGAHLGISDIFESNAIEGGADIVIHSIHKTLPAFTQTSLLHIVRDELVDIKKVKKYMSMFQSTSPSYILMAGIEKCLDVVINKTELFDIYNNNLLKFYKKMKELECLEVLDYRDVKGNAYRDKSKIIIASRCKEFHRYGGVYIYDRLLKDFDIQLEMKSIRYALAMTSICDKQEGFDRLANALIKIDRDLQKNKVEILPKMLDNSVSNVDNLNVEKASIYADWGELPIALKCYSQYPPSEARNMLITTVDLEESVDRIAADYIYLYPPDIPIIIPGEVITKEFIQLVKLYEKIGFTVEGLLDDMSKINVIEKGELLNNENICSNG